MNEPDEGVAASAREPDSRAIDELARRITEEILDTRAGPYFRTRAVQWAQANDDPAPSASWPETVAGIAALEGPALDAILRRLGILDEERLAPEPPTTADPRSVAN